MHDLKALRDDPAGFDRGLARRGLAPLAAPILELDSAHRAAQTKAQSLLARRNEVSRAIGQARGKGEAAQPLLDEVARIKAELAALEPEAEELARRVEDLLAGIPNLPAPDVPEGADEHGNIELRRHGEPPCFDFVPKQHFELGEALGLMDFPRAAKLSGARFVVLKGELARLERALGAFMLDLHREAFGYTEVSPPLLVSSETMFGTAQLPKFAEDQFQTTDGRWLIPTAEVPLTNLTVDEILDAAQLPLRWAAFTPCFRMEAGAAGRDTRGMIRQHQFSKVELVSIVTAEQSEAEHQRLTLAAETVLQRLELPYRVMLLCAGDMGFAARKTYDLEVWLPGQGAYREISSCSNCGDFQARRMKTRMRAKDEKATRFVHTLNGSGVAVGRALVAVLENYQRADGTVTVPEALRPHMGGLEVIGG